MSTLRSERPSVFVGSSSEGLKIAQTVQILLDHAFEVELWSQGVFGLGQGTLDALFGAVDRFDFAILVLTADDLIISRGTERASARDNVLFELGLFLGGLGRGRTFMLHDRRRPPTFPTDLAGITAATFELHASGNLEASLGAPCSRLQQTMTSLGTRAAHKAQRLAQAAESIEGTGSQMRSLIRLLARSRKVELDIISAQFGGLIADDRLREIERDLRELQSLLGEKE